MKRRSFIKGILGATAIAAVPAIAKTKEPQLKPILNKDGAQWSAEYHRENDFYKQTAKGEVTVEGRDANGKRVKETIVLNGTTPVVTKKVFI